VDEIARDVQEALPSKCWTPRPGEDLPRLVMSAGALAGETKFAEVSDEDQAVLLAIADNLRIDCESVEVVVCGFGFDYATFSVLEDLKIRSNHRRSASGIFPRSHCLQTLSTQSTR
jgi:hypothetical protein